MTNWLTSVAAIIGGTMLLADIYPRPQVYPPCDTTAEQGRELKRTLALSIYLPSDNLNRWGCAVVEVEVGADGAVTSVRAIQHQGSPGASWEALARQVRFAPQPKAWAGLVAFKTESVPPG